MVAVLFFGSCVEESTLQGFKAKSRFTIFYKELPIESSIFLIDDLNTTNYGSGDRFLVGEYTDDALGTVTAKAFSQYYRVGVLPDSIGSSTYESATLRLTLDYYNYGVGETTDQSISVYDLADTLTTTTTKALPFYLRDDEIPLGPKIGSTVFSVDPKLFNKYRDSTARPVRFIVVPLDDETFGKPLFESAKKVEDKTDSTFVKYFDFVKKFKGIAITRGAGDSDKIIGFNPAAPTTRLVIYFVKTNSKRDSLVLSLSGGIASFNQIVSNKTDELLPTYSDHSNTDMRYVQNGVGIVTKLDFKDFLSFSDTIPNLSINSAEIVIDDVPVQSDFQRTQTGLGLRVLYDNNRFRGDTTTANRTEIQNYKGTVSLNGASAVPNGYVNAERSDQPLTLPLVTTDTGKKYNGFTTLFLQEVFNNYKKGGTVFSNLALYSNVPSAGKTVERVSFHKDNIKLRIYYTIPTVDANE